VEERRFIGAALVLGTAALLFACARSKGGFETDEHPDGGTFGSDAAPKPIVAGQVYGHSDQTLYKIDTDSHLMVAVGDFTNCTNVNDIALDEDSNIYATTGTELWYVETNTARCTKVASRDSGAFPNSLSFVPAGTLSPDKETLVGYEGSDYVKIDPATGAVTKLGSLGGGFESSGDVVSAKGGKTFVSVKGPSCADCLFEIDPVTGAMIKNWGSLGHNDVFGLAFWAGEVYGFTDAGQVFLVTFGADAITSTTDIPITSAPAGLKFRGAGSTTSAPIGPVH
jgi:hypothetical protein